MREIIHKGHKITVLGLRKTKADPTCIKQARYAMVRSEPRYQVPSLRHEVLIGRWNVTIRVNHRVVAQWSVLCIG